MASTEGKVDQLLECLVFLSKYHAIPNSRDALVAGLPLPEGLLTVPLFERAAERAGFVSKVQTMPIADISPLLLPCVLLLENGDACVLLSLDLNKDQSIVVLPQLGGGEQTISAEQLATLYTGQCILLKKQFRFDERSPQVLETRKGHWFWSTLLESTSIYRDVLIASILINLFAMRV